MTATNPAVVRVGSMDGLMFEGEEHGCFCFVPRVSLQEAADGRWSFDEAAYVRTSWHKRNCAFNPQASGMSLFPKPDGLIANPSTSKAADYLRMLQRSYTE